jgi:excisionase family DNA binding protein
VPKRNTERPSEFNTLTQAAAARYAGVSRQAIHKAIAEGRLRSVVVEGPGDTERVMLRDLEAWKRTRADQV